MLAHVSARRLVRDAPRQQCRHRQLNRMILTVIWLEARSRDQYGQKPEVTHSPSDRALKRHWCYYDGVSAMSPHAKNAHAMMIQVDEACRHRRRCKMARCLSVVQSAPLALRILAIAERW